jgi:DNA-binding transcriptional regulator YdaS (Cro superfamily)
VQEIICTSRLAQALALFDSNSEQWCKVKRVLGAAHSLTTTEAWYTLMSDFHI